MNEKSGESEEQRLRQLWNRLALHDALWAILAFDDKTNRRWDIREFMRVGEREIALAIHRCKQLGFPPKFGTALDFGCGVGRLTQALARRFDQTVGVDISDEMIALAEVLNQYRDRARYLRLDESGLSPFRDGAFDFIYSLIVLQHIPTDSAVEHLRQFVRLMRPGGILIFQVPSHRADLTKVETRPMPSNGYRAKIDVAGRAPSAVASGNAVRLSLSVTNTSDVNWIQKDLGSLRLGNHWLDGDGELMVAQDDGRSVIPQVVPSQSTFNAGLAVTAPREPGEYVLELDLVHEAVSWFKDNGSETWRGRVSVLRGAGAPIQIEPIGELPVPAYDDFPAPTSPAIDSTAPDEFPMYGVAKEVVLETLRTSGVEIIDIEDDPRAGHDWVSYRYFARKPNA
jgi:SAM-dependent methyltransferase